MSKNKIIRFRNDFNEVNTSLEVHESRIFFTAVANMRNPNKVDEEGFIQISAQDMLDMGSNPSNISREFTGAAESLLDRKFRFQTHTKEGKVERVINCVSAVDFKPELRTIGIRFNPMLDTFFKEIQTQYTRFNLLDLRGVRRAPTYSLYSMLMQFKETGIFRISVADLRYRLIPLTLEEQQKGKKQSDKYKLYGHFKARVVDPAVEEINNSINTKIYVTYDEIKEGRSVKNLVFHIKMRTDVVDVLDAESDAPFHFLVKAPKVIEDVLTDSQAKMTDRQAKMYADYLSGMNEKVNEKFSFNRDSFFSFIRARDSKYTSKAGSDWNLFNEWLVERLKDLDFVKMIYDPWLKQVGFKPRKPRAKAA